MRGEVVSEADSLAELHDDWNRLAAAAGSPYCLPAWSLAWWRHARPDGARLRVLVVRDGDEVAGVVPLFQDDGPRAACRLLASPVCGQVLPAVEPGNEHAVGAAVAEALDGMDDRPAALELIRLRADSPWPSAFSAGWPGKGATSRVEPASRAPFVDLAGRTAEDWLPSLSPKMRAQIRRARRGLDEAGATVELARPDEMPEAVAALARLHHQRMEGKGPSEAFLPGIEEMLVEAGAKLAPDGQLRLWLVRIEGQIVSAQLFVAAGHQVRFWLGAFEDSYAKLSPGLVGLMAEIEHAIGNGYTHLDLGPGEQDYKRRICDGAADLETASIFPRGDGYLRTQAGLLPSRAKREVGKHLPAGARSALDRLRRR